MIKKIFIWVLPILMFIALIAVIAAQWFWIRSAVQSEEERFRANVYGVLDKAVNFIDEKDSQRILSDISHEVGEIQKGILAADTLKQDSIQQDTILLTNSGEMLLSMRNQDGEETLEWVGRRPMHNEWIAWFSIQPQTQDEKYFDRQFIENLGDYLGIGEVENAGRRRERNQDVQKILNDLFVRIVNQKESSDEKVGKLQESRDDLKRYLQEKLGEQDIRLPFTVEILQQRDISLRRQQNATTQFYYREILTKAVHGKEYFLAIQFESKESVTSFIMANTNWMFISSVFCIIGLMTVFISTIIIITRQQKLSLIKNEFINNMTHEFKTPLATISLATSALQKEKVLSDPKQIASFTSIIRSENERMDKYVERILLQAKLDRREVHLKKVSVNLNTLVEDAILHFRLQVEAKGGDMRVDLDPEGYVIEADEVHMFNAICNLIDNAIKYSGNTVNIHVFTRREKGYFVIGVQDHGIGIPKDAQKKVFKRFYRVPSGNVHNVKGFGLGLSYVKSIIYTHNGEIRLNSKKNKGTLIEILFRTE